MNGRNVLPTCPNCRRRPGVFGYPVYRCQVCGGWCCDRCSLKRLFAVACPHCGRPGTLRHVAYTR